MSESKKMLYEEALPIALKIHALLKPHCIRCKIAGSLRREQPFIGDIEIVCIPKPYEIGLFQNGIAEVVNQWPKVKGELEYGKTKYTQRILPEGIKLDIFFAEEGNWGLIFAIRTGSRDFSHKVLANGWVSRGYKSEGGYLFYKGKKYDVREEKDLFQRIGLNWVEPKNREV